MAKRNNVRRHDASVVQGEGAFVVIRSVTWGEAKAVRAEFEALSDSEKLARNDRFIAEHVVDWNWVDDDDKPLPLPRDEPAIVDQLTREEIEYLNALMTEGENTKN